MSWKVRLAGFEGSLEDLLRLVSERRLPAAEVAVAEVTGQGLGYLRSLAREDLELWSQFLVTLATLVALKARLLLPAPPPERSAEASAEPDPSVPARVLAERLATFRRFQKAAEMLAVREERRLACVGRGPDVEAYRQAMADRDPLEGIDLWELARVWGRVTGYLREAAASVSPPRKEIDLPVLFRRLRRELRRRSPVTLQELFVEVRELVFGLLALLILNQRGEVHLEQPQLWGPIYVYPRPGRRARG
ncbi:MAG: ScpA family protein [Clostridia bacterium]|jgi:segregation and condensation protein A|nr:segregation/condensation protein A [Clostridia bacterium]MDH7573573.1 ScpA family protein [Clostridia bacterium]